MAFGRPTNRLKANNLRPDALGEREKLDIVPMNNEGPTQICMVAKRRLEINVTSAVIVPLDKLVIAHNGVPTR